MDSAYSPSSTTSKYGDPPHSASVNPDVNPVLSLDDFSDFQQIGRGKDSRIYSANCRRMGGKSVVIKVYDKTKISAVKHRSVKREARIMKYLTQKNVPMVTAFLGAFQDHRQMYIVMEHCVGGDLLEQLLREGRAMTEKRVAQEVAYPMLNTLRCMHKLGIIHRDIKLENLFINERSQVMMGDFGLALCMYEERAISPVGTLEYMAPEILRLPNSELVMNGTIRPEDIPGVNEKVDIWSLGVTIFELVTGRSPFDGSSKEEIKASVLAHRMRAFPAFISRDCADFIMQMMDPESSRRPSAEQLMHHSWLLQYVNVPPMDVAWPTTAAPAPITTMPMPAASPAAKKADALLATTGGMSPTAAADKIPAYKPGASSPTGAMGQGSSQSSSSMRSSASVNSSATGNTMTDSPSYAASYSQPISPLAMTAQSPVAPIMNPLDIPPGSLTPEEQHQLATRYSQNNQASYAKWMKIFAALGLGTQEQQGC